MNKKVVIKIVVLLVVVIFIACMLYLFLGGPNDNLRFKQEYENLNGQKNDDGKEYLSVDIPKDNLVKYATFDEVMELFDNGTGILYLGFPECPWCRNAISPLISVAKEEEVNQIYYFNALSIRDEKELDSGKVVTTKKGTKEYYDLVKALSDYLPSYEGLNDDSIKRIYFPSVVFVMGGKIVGFHEGTVDSQDDPYEKLTKDQLKELKEIYKSNINNMFGTCDETC